MSELRWNPTLGEWVVTSSHRQDRTFLPPKDFCPLCPTKPGGFPTEIPAPTYDIVTFQNRFPAFQTPPPVPAVEGTDLYPVRPAAGAAEVICYTPEHQGTLADQPLQRIHNLVRVWRHRYEDLGARPDVDYVFIFENKGTVIGVTLEHPHGQIYAYPFIPIIPARELAAMIRRVARAYDHLPGFEAPFPYMMALHQRPTDGGTHEAAHFHVEFYPPYRRPGRLKYLATAETGGGNFLNDTLPEEKAAELREAVAALEEAP
jgi:galactose-1-phosphate uridylyltransferase